MSLGEPTAIGRSGAEPSDGDGDIDALGDALWLALGDRDALGLSEADMLGLTLALADDDRLLDGLRLALIDELGDTEAEGL